jgi:hypothetical protein
MHCNLQGVKNSTMPKTSGFQKQLEEDSATLMEASVSNVVG